MEIFKSLLTADIVEKSVTIKNLVGYDIGAPVTSTAVDAVIDDQVTTEPTEIFNLTNSGSLSATYNSIKWILYQKSGLTNMESIVGDVSSSSVSAANVKLITVPRETLKQRITPSSVTASISFAPSSGIWYIKDEPVVSTTGDALFQGKLKISDSASFAPTASSTSIGEVFYNYGAFVLRGSIIGDASLSSALSSYNAYFSTSPSTTAIEVTALSFRREQQKTKQIFFCRGLNNEFNYSNNPTYRESNGSVKQDILDLGNMVFATTVGIYDNNNNLLAVAKVNPVSKKTDEDEVIFKIAITY